jgi:hypothetical protein
MASTASVRSVGDSKDKVFGWLTGPENATIGRIWGSRFQDMELRLFSHLRSDLVAGRSHVTVHPVPIAQRNSSRLASVAIPTSEMSPLP